MKFGNVIKSARNAAKLTQEQLGIACGWGDGSPQSRIGNYEKDKRDISASDLAIIARATNKPINYFYSENAEDQTYQKEPEIDTKHLESVIQKIEQIILETRTPLTPEQKAKAISACMSLTDANTPPDTSHIKVALKAVS